MAEPCFPGFLQLLLLAYKRVCPRIFPLSAVSLGISRATCHGNCLDKASGYFQELFYDFVTKRSPSRLCRASICQCWGLLLHTLHAASREQAA